MASATVESSATAAAAADADDDLQLGFDDLPQVDLRHLSQSELYSLSRLSASSPTHSPSSQDDVVVPIPKIDRSVFNESAGSRKQTYFRLRLAPRTTTSDPPPLSAPISRQRTPEPLEEENSTIISLLKDLFAPHAEPEPPVAATPEEESSSIAAPVSYEESVPKSSDSVLGGIPVSTVDLGFSNRKRGRPRKIQTSSVGLENLSAGKEVLVLEDKNDVKASENAIPVAAGDLYRLEEELKRRTEGMRTEEELAGFLKGLSGQGSRMKKRKIVDAGSFGHVLPTGWKLLLSIKSDGDRALLVCNQYISPDGQQFESLKDVSAHLFSSSTVQDATHESSVPIGESSSLVSRMPNENCADATLQMEQNQNDVVSVSAVPVSPMAADHRNEVPSAMGESPRKFQTKESYRCHKCTLAFEEKDDLLLHLLSFHKKSRNRRNDASLTDSLIMKNGKYECQLCRKLFVEKNRFSSHFGSHIKNYVKRVDASAENNLVNKGAPKMQELIATERVSSAVLNHSEAFEGSDMGFPRSKIESDAIPKTQPSSNVHHADSPPIGPLAVSEKNGERTAEYTEEQDRNSGLYNDNVGLVDEAGRVDAEFNPSKDTSTVSSRALSSGTFQIPEKVNVYENVNKVSMDPVRPMEDCGQETDPVNDVFARSEYNNAIYNESLVNSIFGSPMEDMDVDDGDEVDDNVLLPEVEDRSFELEEDVLNSGTQPISSGGRSFVQFGEKCIDSDDLTGVQTSALEKESRPENRLPSSAQEASRNNNQDRVIGGRLQEHGSYNSWIGEKATHFVQGVAERRVEKADTSFPVIPAVNAQACDKNLKGFSGFDIQNSWQQKVFENNLYSVHEKSLSPDANIGKTSTGAMRNFQSPAETQSDSLAFNCMEKKRSSAGALPVAPLDQGFVLNTHQAQVPTFSEPKEYRDFTGYYTGERSRVDKNSGNLAVSNSVDKHRQGETMSSNWTNKGSFVFDSGDLAVSNTGDKHRQGGSTSSICNNNKSPLGFDSRYPLQHEGPIMGFEAWANPPSRRSEEVVPSEHRGSTFFGNSIEDLKRNKEAAFGVLSPSVNHQQACVSGYNMNMFYGGAVPGNQGAENMGAIRNNEPMSGFPMYNQQQPRPRDETMAQSMWRVDQNGNILQNSSLNYVPPSVVQPSNPFPAFNMVSNKQVQNEYYPGNQKLGNTPAAIGGMRATSSGSGGFMEYNFLSAPPSNQQNSHISSFNNQQMSQTFEPNWVEKEALGLFPKMGGSSSSSSSVRHHQVTTLCVLCGNQFSHDGDFGAGDGSVGYMCFNCKAKFAGQINFF